MSSPGTTTSAPPSSGSTTHSATPSTNHRSHTVSRRLNDRYMLEQPVHISDARGICSWTSRSWVPADLSLSTSGFPRSSPALPRSSWAGGFRQSRSTCQHRRAPQRGVEVPPVRLEEPRIVQQLIDSPVGRRGGQTGVSPLGGRSGGAQHARRASDERSGRGASRSWTFSARAGTRASRRCGRTCVRRSCSRETRPPGVL